jgi:hypothetical protein
MTDDLTKKGKADRIRVNIHEIWEVTYWIRKFQCTEEELVIGVAAVGDLAEDLKEYFDRRG